MWRSGERSENQKINESEVHRFAKILWKTGASLHGPSISTCLMSTDMSINPSYRFSS